MKLAALLAAVFLGVLAAELHAWASLVARGIARAATWLLPPPHRERYLEEWNEQIQTLTDAGLNLSALLWAFGIMLGGAPRMAFTLRRQDRSLLAHTRMQTATKRVLDVGLATIMLLVTLPVFLVVASVVRLSSAGPVLIRHTRVGMGGKPFARYKFRTMVVDPERVFGRHLGDPTQPFFKLSHDPRLTRVGRFLRTLSLDELPILLNVIRGDMSLVGPRPRHPKERHGRPFDVRPGMTGPPALDQGIIDDSESLDHQYSEKWSLVGDLVILAKTMVAVFRSRWRDR